VHVIYLPGEAFERLIRKAAVRIRLR